MKLEIGKWYMRRDGAITRIGHVNKTFKPPFRDLCDNVYFENGRADDCEETSYDLIKEVRVTIEEVEPVSEFSSLISIFPRSSLSKEQIILNAESVNLIIFEIERLQKLFEGENHAG